MEIQSIAEFKLAKKSRVGIIPFVHKFGVGTIYIIINKLN